MAEKNLDNLFHDTLRDIYYAERKIIASLPKMIKAASSPELKGAFEKHLKQTEVQVERLGTVFAIINQKPVAKACHAIDGILEEASEIVSDYKGSPALDAAMIASAQTVEHYEITRYGTLKRWAQNLGLSDAVDLLNATLKEESQTDTDLSALADQVANLKARTTVE